MPRVSVGIPTYNGAQYIEDILTALQNQTFSDFDVLISDNGSTDGTSEVCARFVRDDPRFSISRIETTVPVAQNFIRARDLTSAPYFIWLSDDDLISPNYLERLVDALDSNPRALLAVAPMRRTWYSQENPELLFPVPLLPAGDRIDRLKVVLEACRSSWFYGLWRREAAVREWNHVSQTLRHIWGADVLTLLLVALKDGIVTVPEVEFIFRRCRVPNYYPGFIEGLGIRRNYASAAWAEVSRLNFSPEEHRRLKPILARFIGQSFVSVRGLIGRARNRISAPIRRMIRTVIPARPTPQK